MENLDKFKKIVALRNEKGSYNSGLQLMTI